MTRSPPGVAPSDGSLEVAALAYVALPTVIFLVGWIRAPWGIAAAIATAAALASMASRRRSAVAGRGRLAGLAILIVAGTWCVFAGLGHFVYANSDWVVRDAVLVDLVREPWPVRYTVDGVDTLLRAPIGYFLPAALVGKLFGIRTAELALLAWTVAGVWLVFALMLRDRPTATAAAIRIAVFIVFSGMDILGQMLHYNPHPIGAHLEWWAFVFQYSSQTTQLFWVPNHALPGWVAIAWLLGRSGQRVAVGPAILFAAFAPLWSPLTAIGIAPIVGVAVLCELAVDPRRAVRQLLDWRMLLPVAIALALVYPYLLSGSDQVASGSNADLRWVGDDIVPRIIEFVLIEFVGFAVLLLRRTPRDPLLWTAVIVLLLLPIYRFGPYNDLAMRASIPALTLLAIRLGEWLSSPDPGARDRLSRGIAVVLLVIGAVTPFMEFARVFIEPRWDLNPTASVIDVTRGTHYITPIRSGWLEWMVGGGAPK